MFFFSSVRVTRHRTTDVIPFTKLLTRYDSRINNSASRIVSRTARIFSAEVEVVVSERCSRIVERDFRLYTMNFKLFPDTPNTRAREKIRAVIAFSITITEMKFIVERGDCHEHAGIAVITVK